jgi:cellulose synthase/poly-beta-1,6-N-acetylglucosamine synthase-like glycosyltransferase
MFSVVDLILMCIIGVVYLWTFYNIPILIAGVRNARRIKRTNQTNSASNAQNLPSFSVVVPVKNEGKVVGRLFEALSKLIYPKGKVQVVVVEDGSTDDTLSICKKFQASQGNVVVLERAVSNRKPSALNFALPHCTGDFIAVFDADNVPAPDALANVVKYFADPSVAAVQGRNLCINSTQNMLTQFISYEESIWCESYLRGKDTLGLFVHLKGSCQFVRRSVLQRSIGFDETTLSEDMEMSARLTHDGYKIRYGGDVCSWQESPSNLKSLFGQRTRWFRGTMEVAFRYGKLMTKPSLKNFDAEATLFAPFVVMASVACYIVGSGIFFSEVPFNMLWNGFIYFSLVATTGTMLLAGLALVFVAKPKRASNLLWLPFVFGYWCLQGFLALYAAILMLLRRPKRWVRTEKSGAVADPQFSIAMAEDTLIEAR